MFILKLKEGIFKATNVRATGYSAIITTDLEPIDDNCHAEYLDYNRIAGKVSGGKVIYTNEHFIDDEEVKSVWEVYDNETKFARGTDARQ